MLGNIEDFQKLGGANNETRPLFTRPGPTPYYDLNAADDTSRGTKYYADSNDNRRFVNTDSANYVPENNRNVYPDLNERNRGSYGHIRHENELFRTCPKCGANNHKNAKRCINGCSRYMNY